MDLNRKLSQKYQKMNMKQYNVINDNDHQRLFGKFTTTFHTFIYSNEAYKLLNSVKFWTNKKIIHKILWSVKDWNSIKNDDNDRHQLYWARWKNVCFSHSLTYLSILKL